MRAKLLLWIVAAALLVGFLIYRAWSGNHLNATPDARREIEKARQR